MPRNKLTDLNNLLFEQLERLNEAKTPEELEKELKRSSAMVGIGKTIVANAHVALEAQKHIDEYGLKENEQSEMLRLTCGK